MASKNSSKSAPTRYLLQAPTWYRNDYAAMHGRMVAIVGQDHKVVEKYDALRDTNELVDLPLLIVIPEQDKDKPADEQFHMEVNPANVVEATPEAIEQALRFWQIVEPIAARARNRGHLGNLIRRFRQLDGAGRRQWIERALTARAQAQSAPSGF